jgi:serine/threonine protein kinase
VVARGLSRAYAPAVEASGVPQPGETLGPYRLEEALGEGGMGLVFRARRIDDDREVALKLLKSELAGDYVFQHRFRQEARAAAEVRDDHLVAILDADEADGFFPYIAVEYLPGGSLADRLDAEGPLDPADAVRVVGDVAQGLEALHAAGIVHRDVKPANILFDAGGTAKLTDFGLAKGRAYTVLTKPGQVLGTLDYLAPELIRGNAATPQTDLYALGCIAYECVVGKAPFADKTYFEIGMAHLDEAPVDPRELRPELPAPLCSAILAALEKEPADRPAGAAAFAALLAGATTEAAL